MQAPDWHEIIDHILELIESQAQQHDESSNDKSNTFSEAA